VPILVDLFDRGFQRLVDTDNDGQDCTGRINTGVRLTTAAAVDLLI